MIRKIVSKAFYGICWCIGFIYGYVNGFVKGVRTTIDEFIHQ